jgi:hypothetical protein
MFVSSVGMLSTVYAAATGANAIIVSLCGIINTISTIIAFFSLAMFIVGGTLYALAHFLPATGNLRAGLQGWGMGMIIGGIIALVLYIVAPHIVTTVANIGGTPGTVSTQGIHAINAIDCNPGTLANLK